MFYWTSSEYLYTKTNKYLMLRMICRQNCMDCLKTYIGPRSKKSPILVKNLELIKLRYSAVQCEFCQLIYTSDDEIQRLSAIASNSDLSAFAYIDTVLWKQKRLIVCNRCSDCLGGADRRFISQHNFDVDYYFVSKKLS